MRSVHAGAVQTHFCHFYVCEKQPPNDLKQLPKIATNPWKSDAGIARSRFLRGLEKRWFFSEGGEGLGITLPGGVALPAAPHFANKDTNYSKWETLGDIGSIRIKESRNQRIEESKNQGIKESWHQRMKESRNQEINQRIKESRNQRLKESRTLGIKESKTQGIKESKNNE